MLKSSSSDLRMNFYVDLPLFYVDSMLNTTFRLALDLTVLKNDCNHELVFLYCLDLRERYVLYY